MTQELILPSALHEAEISLCGHSSMMVFNNESRLGILWWVKWVSRGFFNFAIEDEVEGF